MPLQILQSNNTLSLQQSQSQAENTKCMSEVWSRRGMLFCACWNAVNQTVVIRYGPAPSFRLLTGQDFKTVQHFLTV